MSVLDDIKNLFSRGKNAISNIGHSVMPDINKVNNPNSNLVKAENIATSKPVQLISNIGQGFIPGATTFKHAVNNLANNYYMKPVADQAAKNDYAQQQNILAKMRATKDPATKLRLQKILNMPSTESMVTNEWNQNMATPKQIAAGVGQDLATLALMQGGSKIFSPANKFVNPVVKGATRVGVNGAIGAGYGATSKLSEDPNATTKDVMKSAGSGFLFGSALGLGGEALTGFMGKGYKASAVNEKIHPDDRIFMARMAEKTALNNGEPNEKEYKILDAIFKGYGINPAKYKNATLPDILTSVLEKDAPTKTIKLRNEKGNRYAGSSSYTDVVPGESEQAARDIKPPKNPMLMGFAESNPTSQKSIISRFSESNPTGAGNIGVEVKPPVTIDQIKPPTISEINVKPVLDTSKIAEVSPLQAKADAEATKYFANDKTGFKQVFAKWIGAKDASTTKAIQLGNKFKNINPDDASAIIHYLDTGDVNVGQNIIDQATPLRKAYDQLLQDAKSSGVNIGYLDNYITHLWKDNPSQIAEKAQAYMSTHPGFRFANGRTISTYAEGKAIGLTQKYDHPAQIIAEYAKSLENTKANINLINDLKNRGLIVDAATGIRTPGMKPIIGSGMPTTSSRVGDDLAKIGNWYAPAEVADKLNKVLSPETLSTTGKALKIGARVSGGAQDILLSGGIPKTPINAFTIAQTMKEMMAGRIKSPITSLFKSLSTGSTEKFMQKNADTIIKMQERNVPVHTDISIDKIIPQKDWVARTFGTSGREVWNSVVNTPTFKRFIPMLQINLFNDIEKAALGSGKSTSEAADIAAKAVKNFYGITGNDTMALRSTNAKNATSAFLFAPRYRESMVNFWINIIKGIKNPLALENRQTATFAATAIATYFGMDKLNQAINGHHMIDNPEGKRDKLLIPIGGGKTLGIPYLSSIATVPRSIGNVAVDLYKGDTAAAGKEVFSNMSMAFKPIVETATNQNYFGQPIYNENASTGTKLKESANYLFNPVTGAYTHPYIREGVKMAQGKQGVVETASKATELPIRWYSTESIKNAPFWQEYDNQKKIEAITKDAKYGKISQDDALKQINKLGGGSVPNGMVVQGNGYTAYKTSTGINFADSPEEAQQKIAEDEFKKSSDNFKDMGTYVLRKSKDATGKTVVIPIDKNKFESQLFDAQLTAYKNTDDYSTWKDTANKLYNTYINKLNDPNTDDLDKLDIQNKIASLAKQYSTYKSYGGKFKKGKAAKKGKKPNFGKLPTLSNTKTPSFKTFSAPKKISINHFKVARRSYARR